MTTTSPSRRLAIAVVIGGCVAAAFAGTPGVARATECPNEQLRRESNLNPGTYRPYSVGLPECRAYEMVSPLEKGGSDATEHAGAAGQQGSGLPAAADGEAAGFFSQVGFGDPEGTRVGAFGTSDNAYVARRSSAGWYTVSATPPARLITNVSTQGLLGDFAPGDMASGSSCGLVSTTNVGAATSVRCAIRASIGSWLATSAFLNTNGVLYEAAEGVPPEYAGSSYDLSRLFFVSPRGPSGGGAYLAADTSTNNGDGIYEAEVGEPAELRLVNVENDGTEIGPAEASMLGGIGTREGQPRSCEVLGSSGASSNYHAISETGEVVYFTACPSNASGGVNTLYARLDHRETIAISRPSPSQCTTCNTTLASAAFEGASADGSKAFFLTSQQLTNADADSTVDLYEYDFDNPPGNNLIQVSGGGLGDLTPGVGAEVQGVVRTSTNGSHAYFVARGVLTTIPNGAGQVAQAGADNLYAWERTSESEGQTKFVAELCSSSDTSGTTSDQACPTDTEDGALWGADGGRMAQVTPDGRYLVFDTYAHLITSGAEAELPQVDAQQIYRYDSQTGDLLRISVGEPSFPTSQNGNATGIGATIQAPDVGVGAMASVGDWGRAISDDGSTVVFSTAEQLQADDQPGAHPSCSGSLESTGCSVYEWHECASQECQDGMHGEVNMLTPGDDVSSADTNDGVVGMSETGADIFLLTRQKLVGQDTDEGVDVYDARADGGFAAPPAESNSSCSGEECQGSLSTGPGSLEAGGSSTATASGNLSAPPFVIAAVEESKAAEVGAVRITSHSSKTLSVSTTGGGTLSLSGSGLVAEKQSATKTGTYTLPLTLTNAEKKLLAKHGHLTLSVTVRFAPTSGKASTATAKVTIKSRAKKKSKSQSKAKRSK